MSTISINKIPDLPNLSLSSQALINSKLKNINAYVAKRMQLSVLCDTYENLGTSYENINIIIENIVLNLENEMNEFISIKEMSDRYANKHDVKNIENAMLSKEYATSYLSKYSTVDDAKEMFEYCSKERRKIMEEMADITMAAGLNITNGGEPPPEE